MNDNEIYCFTSKEKCAIITVLSTVMKADGIVERNEKSFMKNVLRNLGINVRDLQEIVRMGFDECKQIFHSMSEDKKNKVSKCFLEMVGIDGHVDLRELKVLHQLL